jgi:hypothetical protein
MKKIMMLGAALLALQALPALAQEDVPPPPPGKEGPHHGGHGKFFEKMDADKDGAVSEAEFLKSSKEKFVELDANKDGKVTKEEHEARRAEMKKKWEERKAAKDGEKPADAPKAE